MIDRMETLNNQEKKYYQTLLAWKEFYLECKNEFKAMKLDNKILRFEAKHFGE